MRILLTCPASSAGLERLFSSFGLIHTKLRNRLWNEKVAKLVKVYTSLRDGNSIKSEEDNFDIVLSEDIEILWFELRSPYYAHVQLTFINILQISIYCI